jgi:hypothetical protein
VVSTNDGNPSEMNRRKGRARRPINDLMTQARSELRQCSGDGSGFEAVGFLCVSSQVLDTVQKHAYKTAHAR